MRKLKMSSAELVAAARARIEEVETADAIAMADDPSVLFVDLRDPRERDRAGSYGVKSTAATVINCL